MDVPDAVVYGLIGGFTAVLLIDVFLVITIYFSRSESQPPPLPEKPREPPDRYPVYPQSPPQDPGVVLVPPIVAPLPPVDYTVDAQDGVGQPTTPEAFVIPVEPDLRPPPKKTRMIVHVSSSSSSSESDDSDSECHAHSCSAPALMMLVQPKPTGMTVFTPPLQPSGLGVEEQTKQAVVGAIQTPCSGPCF